MDAPDNCKWDQAGAPCSTPRGENISHGDSVLSFEENAGTGEDMKCTAITSTCNDGTWYKDIKPTAKRTCALSVDSNTVVETKNCKMGDIIIPNDTTYTFYKEVKSNGEYTYEKTKRYCFEGKLE